MNLRSSLLLLVAIQVASCASTSKTMRVDDALLGEVDSAEMAEISSARVERDAAIDRHATAAREARIAADSVEVARRELATSRSVVEETRVALATARRDGTVAQVEIAESDHAWALAASEASRTRVALLKREAEAAQLAEKVRLEESRYATAQVEATKALAVQDVNLAAARRVPVKDIVAQARFHELEAKLARVRHESALDRVADSREDYDTAVAAADALSVNARAASSTRY